METTDQLQPMQVDFNTVSIVLGAHIALTNHVNISFKVGTIRVNGNGYSLSGQGNVQCFYVVNAKVELSDVNVTNGYGVSGGCIYASNSTLHLNNVTVADCYATSYGGAIALVETTGALAGSRVVANTAATMGGGLSLAFSEFDIRNSDISSNTVSAGSSSSKGGGIYLSGSTATVDVHSSNICDNVASLGAGKEGVFISHSIKIPTFAR